MTDVPNQSSASSSVPSPDPYVQPAEEEEMASSVPSPDPYVQPAEEEEVEEESMTVQELINHANQVTQRAVRGLEHFLYRNDQNRAGRLVIQDEYERILVLRDTLVELRDRLTREQ
jgi:hypothetical protein